jgi:hypothetical protein
MADLSADNTARSDAAVSFKSVPFDDERVEAVVRARNVVLCDSDVLIATQREARLLWLLYRGDAIVSELALDAFIDVGALRGVAPASVLEAASILVRSEVAR